MVNSNSLTKINEQIDNDFILQPNNYVSDTITQISLSDSSFNPSIFVELNNIPHIVWFESNRILYRHFNPLTGEWNGFKSTRDILFYGVSWFAYPTIVVDNIGNVHVTFEAKSNLGGSGSDVDIYYCYYDISKQIWTGKNNEYFDVISTESNNESIRPQICVDKNNTPYICWSEINNESRNIVFKFYDSNTNQWKGFVNQTDIISDESIGYETEYSSIACDSFSIVHIVYSALTDIYDSGQDIDIFYKYYNNTLQKWIGKINNTDLISSDSTEVSYDPQIAIDNKNGIHIIWTDYTDIFDATGNSNIFYKQWGGENWSGNVNSTDVISYNILSTGSPAITTDNRGFIHFSYSGWINLYGSNKLYIIHRYWDSYVREYSENYILTYDFDLQVESKIAADSFGNIHVCWKFDDFPDLIIMYQKLIFYFEEPQLISYSYNRHLPGWIYLDWEDVFGATEYYIFENKEFFFYSKDDFKLVGITTESSYRFHNNKVGSYTYWVVASNGETNSTPSYLKRMYFDYFWIYSGGALAGIAILIVSIITGTIIRSKTIK